MALMNHSAIKHAVEQIVTPFLTERGFELVDVEYVKEGSHYFLRVYCDKEGGIDIDECQLISEFLSLELDKNDPLPNQMYFLDVSSPGAERPLKTADDLTKAVGKAVYVTTYEKWEGSKQFEGTLLAFDGEQLTIEQGKKPCVIPYDKVASARLTILF